ncbi:hypothetical protein OIU78_022836 [Salix suchowensis]|nr:hypothetical protein OIU78_022836 [Salix suchowensis]
MAAAAGHPVPLLPRQPLQAVHRMDASVASTDPGRVEGFEPPYGNGGSNRSKEKKKPQEKEENTMSGPSSCSIYIGNLDERVSDRVLYDILIQAGRVVDLHIPRDRETEKPKGYAFAEYETEEIADYAVKLFSGLVTLYNRTLKFAISGQDKLAQNNSNGAVPGPNYSNRQRPSSHPVSLNNFEISNHSVRSSAPSRVSAYPANDSLAPPGVTNLSNGYGSNSYGNSNDSDRRLFGSAVNAISRTRSRWNDTSNPMPYSY